MIKKIFLMVLVFLIILPISLAQNPDVTVTIKDYNESGRRDNLYQLGLGRFNSLLNPVDIDAQSQSVLLTKGRKIPLISDLDGDGIAEIIVLDQETFEIYQNKTLDFVTAFNLDTAFDERFSNILIFDIDGDGLSEIIVVAEKEKELHILEFNGTTLVNQTRFAGTDLSGLSFTGEANRAGEVAIKCSSTERCLMTYADNIRSGFTPGFGKDLFFFATFFNSSEEGISTAFETAIDSEINSVFGAFCQPNIRHIASIDYDGDNGGATADPSEFEFIATNMKINHAFGQDEEVNIYWIDILPNRSVVLENSEISTRPGDIFSVGSDKAFTCDNSNGDNINIDGSGLGFPLFPAYYVTSPMVFNADPVKAGLEAIVGMGVDADEFIMVVFEKDGTDLGRFPAFLLGDSEGIMISNIFKADIFDDSTEDFCVMGFAGDPIGAIDESISVTCGTLADPNGFGTFPQVQSLEFRFDKSGRFNLSEDYDVLDKLAHSGEFDSTNDLDEVVSAYGIFKLDRNSCLDSIFNNDCTMELIFAQPKQSNNPRVITTDAYDKFGLEDMIVMTDTNLFYLDDLVTNQPINEFCGESGSVTGQCTRYILNPCLDSVWKKNTTVQIKMTPSDPEDDLTAIRARIYAGTSNEQDSGFVNISSGAEFTISTTIGGDPFTANLSGGGFSMILQAVDIVENPSDIESITKAFSVAETGVETFDCTTTAETGVEVVEVPDEIIDASLTVDATRNSVITGLETFEGISGLAGTTIWLILMIAFSLFIWFELGQSNMSGSSALGVIGIVNVLMIVLGARLGILSTALVVIIVVLGVVILGVFLGKFLTGIGTTGNGGV